MNNIWEKHIPVLLEELVNSIKTNNLKENTIVDCTLWMAWHAIEIMKKLQNWDIFIGFDADSINLELAKKRIIQELKENNIEYCFINSKEDKNKNKINIILINSNFSNIKEELEERHIEKITGVYYDLGLSSLHLDEAERWFSFMKNGPLDMRLDKTRWKTAAQIINWYTAAELREIFIKYWEEPWSNKIAHQIVDIRKQKKFETTHDLANIIQWPVKVKARIFQAIRIEVNQELSVLEKSLKDAIGILESNWIIFVISFHSLEDRITKQILKKETKDCICSDMICSCQHIKSLKLLNKKPILPSSEEISKNSRSRSAKARVAQKL